MSSLYLRRSVVAERVYVNDYGHATYRFVLKEGDCVILSSARSFVLDESNSAERFLQQCKLQEIQNIFDDFLKSQKFLGWEIISRKSPKALLRNCESLYLRQSLTALK